METKNSLPRDLFMYLLSIVALGMAAVNWGVLLFQFINIRLPDIVSDPYYNASMYYGSIRWAISTLVIVFPVLVWTLRFLRKDINNNPEKKELKIRKWLIYFTLFVASVVVIGDLIALIFNYLEGGLTLRFFLKILVVLGISSSILVYYLNELKEEIKALKWFNWGIISLVVVSVVGGFVTVGSPNVQRQNKFDERRVQDLQTIQGQVINYWQSKSKLPTSLNDLRNDITGFVVPVDPATGQPYQYNVLDNLKFSLCATFQSSGGSQMEGGRVVPVGQFDTMSNWIHGVGSQCFERTIDPDLYPPYPKALK